MKNQVSILILVILFASCKKANERGCWKTFGSLSAREIGLDSIKRMVLNSGLTYVMHQSNAKKVEIVGGENMIDLVEIKTHNFQLEITNQSYCNFLRDFEKKITVHIYYPQFDNIYAEVSDSLIFADTIKGNLMQIEMREAGGVAVMTTDLNDLRVLVSAGTGHFKIDGFAKFATLKTQGQGFGDALGLKSKFLFGYQNSRANLKLNLAGTEANIIIDGAGDVLYSGEAQTLEFVKNGAGNFIKY